MTYRHIKLGLDIPRGIRGRWGTRGAEYGERGATQAWGPRGPRGLIIDY